MLAREIGHQAGLAGKHGTCLVDVCRCERCTGVAHWCNLCAAQGHGKLLPSAQHASRQSSTADSSACVTRNAPAIRSGCAATHLEPARHLPGGHDQHQFRAALGFFGTTVQQPAATHLESARHLPGSHEQRKFPAAFLFWQMCAVPKPAATHLEPARHFPGGHQRHELGVGVLPHVGVTCKLAPAGRALGAYVRWMSSQQQ